MKWSFVEPSSGDMIRVKLGSIYHYGIFADDGEIIQFGLPPVLHPADKSTPITVCTSDIDTFLCGGFLEVAEFTKAEQRKNRSPEETLKIARSRIGETGYHIIHNNCEHFAYECLTGKKYSSQTDFVRSFFRSMPLVDLYIAPIPESTTLSRLSSEARQKEIDSVKNERVKREKYYVWRLLEYGLERSLGLKAEKLSFEKGSNGKWMSPSCFFSLSHTDGVVAVAISRAPIGVDIEWSHVSMSEKIADKILCRAEKDEYFALPENEKHEYLVRKWTAKEGIYKKSDDTTFKPEAINTLISPPVTDTVEICGKSLIFSVATATPEKLKIYKEIDPKKLK